MARLHTGRHQGALDLPQLPRRHPPRGQRHRRPAPLGQRPRLGRHGALLRAVPLPQRLPRDHRGRGVRARARSTWPTSIALEGPQTIAAIMLEAIPGTAGIMIPPPGYLAGVRALCDEHGIVLIADEVMSGFGRAGRWFAVRARRRRARPAHLRQGRELRLRPARRRGHQRRDRARPSTHRAYPGGLTYSGHPLACAAAVATIRTMEDDGVVEHADRLGEEVFGPGLAELARQARVGRRGPRHRAPSGRSSWSPTGPPASRWRRTAARARP